MQRLLSSSMPRPHPQNPRGAAYRYRTVPNRVHSSYPQSSAGIFRQTARGNRNKSRCPLPFLVPVVAVQNNSWHSGFPILFRIRKFYCPYPLGGLNAKLLGRILQALTIVAPAKEATAGVRTAHTLAWQDAETAYMQVRRIPPGV